MMIGHIDSIVHERNSLHMSFHNILGNKCIVIYMFNTLTMQVYNVCVS